jgi:hypothetical protein
MHKLRYVFCKNMHIKMTDSYESNFEHQLQINQFLDLKDILYVKLYINDKTLAINFLNLFLQASRMKCDTGNSFNIFFYLDPLEKFNSNSFQIEKI